MDRRGRACAKDHEQRERPCFVRQLMTVSKRVTATQRSTSALHMGNVARATRSAPPGASELTEQGHSPSPRTQLRVAHIAQHAFMKTEDVHQEGVPSQENSAAKAARATQARKRNVPADRSNQRQARSPPQSRGASATCPKPRAPWGGTQPGPRPRACAERAARRRPRTTPAQRRWMRGGRWRAQRPQLSGPGQTWWQRPSWQRQ